MDATSQNVANADSEGFHRRRVTLSARNISSPGLYTSNGTDAPNGTGVGIESFERVRDSLLEKGLAEATSGESGAREETRLLSVLEGTLATDTDRSLSASLETLFDGFNDLANHPEDEGVREALIGHAESLKSTFRRVDDGIEELKTDAEEALSSSVESANELIDEVASLNKTIREARAGGSPDFAAEDRRDAAVKELAERAPVEIQERSDGFTLTVDGMTVVQGEESTELTIRNPTGSPPSVEFGDTGVEFQGGTKRGEIGAQLQTLNETLPDVQSDLDALAKTVVEDVNSIHENAFDLNDDTNESFFDPTATEAGTIRLDGSIQGPKDIAAFEGDGSGNALRGDTTPAQDIAALSGDLTPQATELSTKVGAEVSQAASTEEARAAVVDRLQSQIDAVSGVSIDQQMSNLIEQQQAFAASSRVLRTAQQVTDTLLSI